MAQPLCIPTTYTDDAGRYCLAYPRSPHNPARWLVIRCASRDEFDAGDDSARSTDLECVHDDFGTLVPVRQRTLSSDFASSLSWKPVTSGALQ